MKNFTNKEHFSGGYIIIIISLFPLPRFTDILPLKSRLNLRNA